ncbi:MAG TPA: nucleoside hydrolase [Chthoniobacterales bacterium]|nr:nucleoside hydrolase [Chthoniobacterales bacterium]
MSVRKALLFAAVFALTRAAVAERVWIDTDVSIGSPFREVDDAYALVLAFHSPELRIAGISASYGNADVGRATRVAREMTERFGPAGVRVFAGAKSPEDRGRRTEASEALASALTNESITYLALGPLTNLAAFAELHPNLTRRIRRVIIVGAQAEGTTLRFGPKKTFSIHDANIFKDPRAAAVVLASQVPITLAPPATAADLLITEKELRELEGRTGAPNYLARRSKVWLWFWTHIVGTNGGPIFDALAVAAAAKPALISTDRGYARLDQAGNLIVSSRRTPGSRPVRFCRRFTPQLKNVVLERLRNSR